MIISCTDTFCHCNCSKIEETRTMWHRLHSPQKPEAALWHMLCRSKVARGFTPDVTVGMEPASTVATETPHVLQHSAAVRITVLTDMHTFLWQSDSLKLQYTQVLYFHTCPASTPFAVATVKCARRQHKPTGVLRATEHTSDPHRTRATAFARQSSPAIQSSFTQRVARRWTAKWHVFNGAH